jgi:CheY-like chemotaxis protein
MEAYRSHPGVTRSVATMASLRTILLIEDDFAIREALAEILGTAGFQVTCACNGAEALVLLSERTSQPSLILLDLMMPVMDGWEFRRAQARDPAIASIPVVVLSASAGHDATLHGMAAAAVLAKPFELDHLLDTVDRLCPQA